MKLFCKKHGVYFSASVLNVGQPTTTPGKMAELHSRGYDGCEFVWVEEPVSEH